MKVQAIISSNLVNQGVSQQGIRSKKTAANESGFNNANMIAFKGNNPDHIVLVAAETQGLQVKGGVSTVVNDYFGMPNKQLAGIFPFNNAQLIHEVTGAEVAKDKNGKVKVAVHQFPKDYADESLRGKYFWTGANQDTTPLSEIMKDPKKYVLLDKIAEKQAPWDTKQTVSLFRVQQKGRINGVQSDIFLYYDETLGMMREPYDTAAGGYSSKTLEELRNARTMTSEFRASEYAGFDRGAVEFLDEVVRNTRTTDGSTFSPKSISCSDGQTAMVAHYMKELGKTDIEPFFTIHNGNPGYTGETGGRQIFQDLLLSMNEAQRNETIDNLVKNEEYQKALISGKEEEFFRKYIPMLVDDNRSFNPVLVPLQLAIPSDENIKKFGDAARGFVKGVNTVSNGYSDDLAYNENMGSGIQSMWRSLYKRGLALGILNPLNDPRVSGFEDSDGVKKGYLPGYESQYTITYPDGHTETVSPFKRFREALFKNAAGEVNVTADSLRHVEETRLDNQINFLRRLTGVYDADGFTGEIRPAGDGKVIKGNELRNLLINGLGGKDVELIGHISQEVLGQFEAAKAGTGKAPAVFVSWGRLDDQKAMDQVMQAFDKFRKTNPDAVLILGGPAAYEKNGELQPCSKKIIEMAQRLSKKHDGHFVFMNGFAPGKVLSGVADAAIFPSRFAPCELTDLENKKYLSRVIVTNTQGLADKNFDPEIEADRPYMDGYKTEHGFFNITRQDIEADEKVGRIFREGIAEDNLAGYKKIYETARTTYLSRMSNSGTTYESALIENYKKVLKGILDDSLQTQVDEALKALKLTDEEKTKLTPLMQSQPTEKEQKIVQQFIGGSKLSDEESKTLIRIIENSALTDAENARFKGLLDGTVKSSVEDKLLRLILTKENLRDKNVVLTGALNNPQIQTMKEYLANVNAKTRTKVEYEIINNGLIDESQIRAAKQIFNLDPIHNLILKEDKLKVQFNKLFERCKNEMLENEIVHCMGRTVGETEANRIAMLKNQYLLNTTWGGNARLTGVMRDGKPVSSLYLYEEILKSSPSAGEAARKDNSFLSRILNAIKPSGNSHANNIAQAGTNNPLEAAANAAEDAAKKASGMSKGMKIALGAGAAILALGGAYYAMSSKEKSNADGDTFKPSTTNTNKAPAANTARRTAPASQKNPAQKRLDNPYLATK